MRAQQSFEVPASREETCRLAIDGLRLMLRALWQPVGRAITPSARGEEDAGT